MRCRKEQQNIPASAQAGSAFTTACARSAACSSTKPAAAPVRDEGEGAGQRCTERHQPAGSKPAGNGCCWATYECLDECLLTKLGRNYRHKAAGRHSTTEARVCTCVAGGSGAQVLPGCQPLGCRCVLRQALHTLQSLRHRAPALACRCSCLEAHVGQNAGPEQFFNARICSKTLVYMRSSASDAKRLANGGECWPLPAGLGTQQALCQALQTICPYLHSDLTAAIAPTAFHRLERGNTRALGCSVRRQAAKNGGAANQPVGG